MSNFDATCRQGRRKGGRPRTKGNCASREELEWKVVELLVHQKMRSEVVAIRCAISRKTVFNIMRDYRNIRKTRVDAS